MTNESIARTILDEERYVVLATADRDGAPWASPVWFAHEGYRELYWASRPDSRHSRNIAECPQIAMVAYDSTVRTNSGQAVYLTGTAEQVTDPGAVQDGIAVYSRESVRQGDQDEWGPDQVTGEAELRLYRVRVQECWILDPARPGDSRVEVRL